MSDKSKSIESLGSWLSKKSYCEQQLWKFNIEKDLLTDKDVEYCYQLLLEHLGLISPIPGKKLPISFKNEIVSIQVINAEARKIKILEVKDFVDVNALSPDCSVKFGPNLTLVYGSNGSGKSGIGRLLCNACFSRGKREILPNVKIILASGHQATATFVIDDGLGAVTEVKYSLGKKIDDLKRFSVFDSESVLIHLDQSNNVNFTPAQIKIFDKVAATISKLEEKLNNEKSSRRKNNPFQSMFIDDVTTATAIFCKGITGATKKTDFLKHANFDFKSDEVAMASLQKEIDEKKKLDIPKKKSQLMTEKQNLEALKVTLQGVLSHFTDSKMQEANQLIKDVTEKKKIVESLSVESFNDGILSTIGSLEWKALISAAKELYEKEKIANEGKELKNCMLCHQKLTKDEMTLFQKYWEFLESKAQSELSQLMRRQTALLQELQLVKTTYPKLLDTDAGVKVLKDENLEYLDELKMQFKSLKEVLNDWIAKIGKLQAVNRDDVAVVNLQKIDNIIVSKTTEESTLVDPTGDIVKLTIQLDALKHKKAVTAVKDAALEYIAYLNWLLKANSVNFPGIKMAITKKRTEWFLIGVVQNYKGVFNQELAKLDCKFNLVILASGEQGNTVKEYRLDFAEDYNPSQILSEGEQNVCSLADFLTEIQLDKNNCGIIFDDPVSSLDHERKNKIAQRLAEEAGQRQVVVFTHDIVFMSQLVKHADRSGIPTVAHWMRKVNDIPGCVEDNTSPRLASLVSLKNDSKEAVKEFSSLGAKEQERALGVAFDYLRSACEAMIEEVLFADTIQRYDDNVKVTNLEEVIFDQAAALKIVDLHGRISEVILAHNRSDQQRENSPTIEDLNVLRREFDELEVSLRASRRAAIKNRDIRREAKTAKKIGW